MDQSGGSAREVVGHPAAWRAWLGSRRIFFLLVLVAAGWAWSHLGLSRQPLAINPGGQKVWREFIGAAWQPALTYESAAMEGVPRPPLLVRVIRAAFDTLRFAGAAVALSVVFGMVLGFFASSSWLGERVGGWRWMVGWAFHGVVKVVITLCRSIHELIWAIILLSAMGLTPLAAVIAITIPYTGTLAKVFAEMLDETPREPMLALRAGGAGPLQAWVTALLPEALPDLLTYILYRFECGLRSASILGWWGFGTLGLYLQQSYDNGDYRETWTYLGAMLALIFAFDAWSSAVRKRLRGGGREKRGGQALAVMPHGEPILWEQRPRDAMLRRSVYALLALALLCLVSGLFINIKWSPYAQSLSQTFATQEVTAVFSPAEWARRGENVRRFWEELKPPPMLEGARVSWRQWLGGIGHFALPAAWTTLAISILSICLAAGAAVLTLPLAARVSASATPWQDTAVEAPVWKRGLWAAVRLLLRVVYVFARAVPEIILAFLLLQVLRGNVWPAILGLAVHNFGILGRLGSETLENAPAELPRALRGMGAGRLQILGFGLLPVLLSRFLLYFFYRWETCLRESTALGILGCLTLGYYINQAKAGLHYDVMIVLALVGAGIVICGDVAGALMRAWMRRSG